jgi:hypothetical protein
MIQDALAGVVRDCDDGIRLPASEGHLAFPQEARSAAGQREARIPFSDDVVDHDHLPGGAQHRDVAVDRRKQQDVGARAGQGAAHAQHVADGAMTVGRGGDGGRRGGADQPYLSFRRHAFRVLGRVHEKGVAAPRVKADQRAEQSPGVAAVAATILPAGGVDTDLHVRLVGKIPVPLCSRQIHPVTRTMSLR